MWITWHYSQRSRSLSQDLNMPIWEYVNDGNVVKRHLISSLYTIYILCKNRPTTICIQYSFMLLIVVAVYKIFTFKRVIVICDCHTKALRRTLNNRLGFIFNTLKCLSFKFADICIISNDLMVDDVRPYARRYFILPDKIPDLMPIELTVRQGSYCVFVGAYAVDEPFGEVVGAARYLASKTLIYCTGKIPKRLVRLRHQPYVNIRFTDYLPDKEYYNLIANAQCILALTTEDGCLQCAGYEAMALSVPLVVSKTDALSNYFENCVVYVENNAISIANGVRQAMRERESLIDKMKKTRIIRKNEYEEKLAALVFAIESMKNKI